MWWLGPVGSETRWKIAHEEQDKEETHKRHPRWCVFCMFLFLGVSFARCFSACFPWASFKIGLPMFSLNGVVLFALYAPNWRFRIEVLFYMIICDECTYQKKIRSHNLPDITSLASTELAIVCFERWDILLSFWRFFNYMINGKIFVVSHSTM